VHLFKILKHLETKLSHLWPKYCQNLILEFPDGKCMERVSRDIQLNSMT